MLHLSGQRFGRLVVVRRTSNKDKFGRCYLWECACDCGNTCFVSGNQLKSGQVRSCGCLRRDIRKSDITGQRYGSLVAVAPTPAIRDHSVIWLWQCDCGKTITATLDVVKYGGKRSCGCKNRAIKQQQAIDMQAGCGRVGGTAICAVKSNTLFRNNRSGYRGVSWHKASQAWVARIQFRGKSYSLGYYSSPEKASAAYQKFKKKFIQEIEEE